MPPRWRPAWRVCVPSSPTPRRCSCPETIGPWRLEAPHPTQNGHSGRATPRPARSPPSRCSSARIRPSPSSCAPRSPRARAWCPWAPSDCSPPTACCCDRAKASVVRCRHRWPSGWRARSCPCRRPRRHSTRPGSPASSAPSSAWSVPLPRQISCSTYLGVGAGLTARRLTPPAPARLATLSGSLDPAAVIATLRPLVVPALMPTLDVSTSLDDLVERVHQGERTMVLAARIEPTLLLKDKPTVMLAAGAGSAPPRKVPSATPSGIPPQRPRRRVGLVLAAAAVAIVLTAVAVLGGGALLSGGASATPTASALLVAVGPTESATFVAVPRRHCCQRIRSRWPGRLHLDPRHHRSRLRPPDRLRHRHRHQPCSQLRLPPLRQPLHRPLPRPSRLRLRHRSRDRLNLATLVWHRPAPSRCA